MKIYSSAIKSLMNPKKKRKGVHAKTKSSKCKTSKNYVKRNRGQG